MNPENLSVDHFLFMLQSANGGGKSSILTLPIGNKSPNRKAGSVLVGILARIRCNQPVLLAFGPRPTPALSS